MIDIDTIIVLSASGGSGASLWSAYSAYGCAREMERIRELDQEDSELYLLDRGGGVGTLFTLGQEDSLLPFTLIHEGEEHPQRGGGNSLSIVDCGHSSVEDIDWLKQEFLSSSRGICLIHSRSHIRSILHARELCSHLRQECPDLPVGHIVYCSALDSMDWSTVVLGLGEEPLLSWKEEKQRGRWIDQGILAGRLREDMNSPHSLSNSFYRSLERWLS